MTGAADVTVVLPTHNRADLVSEALGCALAQEDVDVEVIVVDDGSDDRTRELLDGVHDERVRVIRNEASRGVAAARNQALQAAHGTWVAFLDDDDLWAPQWLRTALDAAEDVDDAVIYGARVIVDEHRRAWAGHFAEHPSSVPATLRECNSIGGPSGVVVHRDVIAVAGPFDERLSALADWEAWLRFVERGRLVAVPDLLVGYTVYRDNMHRRDPMGVLAEFQRFRAIVAERQGTAGMPPEAPFLRWLARDVADTGRRWQAARLFARAARWDGLRGLLRALRCLVRRPSPPPVPLAQPAWLAEYRTPAGAGRA